MYLPTHLSASVSASATLAQSQPLWDLGTQDISSFKDHIPAPKPDTSITL